MLVDEDDALLADESVLVDDEDRLEAVLVDELLRLLSVLALDNVDVLELLRLDSVLVELLERLDSSPGAAAPPSQKASGDRYPAANGHLR